MIRADDLSARQWFRAPPGRTAAMLDLMKLTLPSARSMLTPPGWSCAGDRSEGRAAGEKRGPGQVEVALADHAEDLLVGRPGGGDSGLLHITVDPGCVGL